MLRAKTNLFKRETTPFVYQSVEVYTDFVELKRERVRFALETEIIPAVHCEFAQLKTPEIFAKKYYREKEQTRNVYLPSDRQCTISGLWNYIGVRHYFWRTIETYLCW